MSEIVNAYRNWTSNSKNWMIAKKTFKLFENINQFSWKKIFFSVISRNISDQDEDDYREMKKLKY